MEVLRMEGVKGQCFICERQVTDHCATPDEGEDAELETTVFVLRKVLQAPAFLVEKFLKGTPCDCGLGVCPECRLLFVECREVYEELCQVKRKWSEVKAKVVNKMKGSAAEEGEEVARGVEDVRKETRRFVIQHLHGVSVSSPLPSGQDNRRQPAPEENQEADTESNTASHYVVIEHVVEQDRRDVVGDGVEVVEVALPLKKALIRRRKSQKQNISPGVKKHPASQKTKMSYDCLFCPAQRTDVTALEVHLRSHTGERPFWCGVCGKECTRKGALDLHRLVHSGEKSHECNLCQKRFRIRSHLDIHVRAHLGEKPWKCPDCGKAFVQKGDLTKHRVVHTGQRPFKCDVCGKRFSRGDHLTRHKKRHSAVVKAKSRK